MSLVFVERRVELLALTFRLEGNNICTLDGENKFMTSGSLKPLSISKINRENGVARVKGHEASYMNTYKVEHWQSRSPKHSKE